MTTADRPLPEIFHLLSPFEDDGLSRYHAAKLFMGAAAVGARVVALFGPTHTISWGPWTEKKVVVSSPCACTGQLVTRSARLPLTVE